jgi:transposase
MSAGRCSTLLTVFKLKEAVMTATTRPVFGSVSEPTLYVAFELGKKEWKLGLTSGFGVTPMVRRVASGDLRAVERVLAQARVRLGLPAAAPVVSCYEAGRDGFWIHRALTQMEIANRVVDSASIEVNRRKRRTKTDRVDALKLVMMLVRVCYGERRAWQEVRVPSVADEAARHVSRERTALTAEQTRLRNQITSYVATWGCVVSARARQAPRWWTTVRDWTAAPLPLEVQARIARTDARLALVAAQIATIETQQVAVTRTARPDSALGRLVRLKSIATTSAAVLLGEGLVWREFQNRREIGGLLGFAPTKYASGESTRDQGISRAGNPRLQSISIQLAWSWVRWQPSSGLTRWFHDHFGPRKRERRVGIVALARKLMIALWRYVTRGIVPEGAILKTASVG